MTESRPILTLPSALISSEGIVPLPSKDAAEGWLTDQRTSGGRKTSTRPSLLSSDTTTHSPVDAMHSMRA